MGAYLGYLVLSYGPVVTVLIVGTQPEKCAIVLLFSGKINTVVPRRHTGFMTKSADFEGQSKRVSGGLAALLSELSAAEPEPEPEVVAGLVAEARLQQRQLVAVLICLQSKAAAHASAGVGPPVEEVLQDGRSVSDVTVYRDRMRAQVAEAFPVVGKAVAAGEVFPENLDV